jgi:hypothetical protein
MHGNPNRAGLIRHSAGYGLADPLRCTRAERETFLMLKALGRLHETILPSWIRSNKANPPPAYRLAIQPPVEDWRE